MEEHHRVRVKRCCQTRLWTARCKVCAFHGEERSTHAAALLDGVRHHFLSNSLLTLGMVYDEWDRISHP